MTHAPLFGGWLTGPKIMAEYQAGRILIDPFDPACLRSNSYDYRLSPKLLRMVNALIDVRQPDEFEEIDMPDSGYLLQPGECYLGSTVEVFGSRHYPALVTGRSSIGRKFLTNHVTAGLIDQGFVGSITLEIVAERPTMIYPNIHFGQISWIEASGEPMPYSGRYQGQYGPTPSRFHAELRHW